MLFTDKSETFSGLFASVWSTVGRFNGYTYSEVYGPTLSQSGEISPDFCRFYGGGIRHNEDIMHSFQNFIVWLIPNHPLPLETRIWKLVVRALVWTLKLYDSVQ